MKKNSASKKSARKQKAARLRQQNRVQRIAQRREDLYDELYRELDREPILAASPCPDCGIPCPNSWVDEQGDLCCDINCEHCYNDDTLHVVGCGLLDVFAETMDMDEYELVVPGRRIWIPGAFKKIVEETLIHGCDDPTCPCHELADNDF